MRKPAIESSVTRSIIVGVALTCLGAAVVFASPFHVKLDTGVQTTVQRVSATPLAKGPAVRLMRGVDGSDEDCVEVTKVVGAGQSPYGDLYVPHGVTCE